MQNWVYEAIKIHAHFYINVVIILSPNFVYGYLSQQTNKYHSHKLSNATIQINNVLKMFGKEY